MFLLDIGVNIVSILVHCWYTVGTVLVHQCTNRQKQSKDSQNSKNDHWCTNRHMSTQSPPNTQSALPLPAHLRDPSLRSDSFKTGSLSAEQ